MFLHTPLTLGQLPVQSLYRPLKMVSSNSFKKIMDKFSFFPVPSASTINISATTQNATTLHITWKPSTLDQQNGIIRSYEITLSVLETGSSQQLTSTMPELMLLDLHPFYTYSFLIAAVTIGPGPASETFTIQMPQTGNVKYDFPDESNASVFCYSSSKPTAEYIYQCDWLTVFIRYMESTTDRGPEWHHQIIYCCSPQCFNTGNHIIPEGKSPFPIASGVSPSVL